jgi:hypothetical protein
VPAPPLAKGPPPPGPPPPAARPPPPGPPTQFFSYIMARTNQFSMK